MLALEYSSSMTASGANKYTLDSVGQRYKNKEIGQFTAQTVQRLASLGSMEWHHHIAYLLTILPL